MQSMSGMKNVCSILSKTQSDSIIKGYKGKKFFFVTQIELWHILLFKSNYRNHLKSNMQMATEQYRQQLLQPVTHPPPTSVVSGPMLPKMDTGTSSPLELPCTATITYQTTMEWTMPEGGKNQHTHTHTHREYKDTTVSYHWRKLFLSYASSLAVETPGSWHWFQAAPPLDQASGHSESWHQRACQAAPGWLLVFFSFNTNSPH